MGKTTTAVNLGASIAGAGYPTLLVDLDPQCNATVALGLAKDISPNVYEVPVGRADARRGRDSHRHRRAAHRAVDRRPRRRHRRAASDRRLRGDLEQAPRGDQGQLPVHAARLPAVLGPLTVNALVAADKVIVPVQTEYFALEGLAQLLDTLKLIQRELNPRLTVAGMILTMHDGRTRLARDVEREVREHFPELVFDTVVPRNVRLGEAPSFGVPVLQHAPHSAGMRRVPQAGKGGRGPWLKYQAERMRTEEVIGAGHMTDDRRGMGRGLAAILPRSGDEEGLREIPVDLIDPNPRQPRHSFDETKLAELAESDPRARRAAARRGPAAGRRPLRAGRGRAPPAGRAHRRHPADPGHAAPGRRLGAARHRPGREHGEAGPERGRGGARLRDARRRPRAHQGGGRQAAWGAAGSRSPT